MQVLVYSDVHGNLPAFEKMLEQEKNCSAYLCLGDLVNYGPWSNECIDLALSLPNSTILKGNHEDYFIDGKYSGKSTLVQAFFNKAIEKFDRHEKISKFVNETKIDKFTCKHTINDDYIYPDTNVVLDSNYMIGHSHHQFLYKYLDYELINVGSVGQNRKKIEIINYILVDLNTKLVAFKHLHYDITPVIKQMNILKYPNECVAYYLSKL
jgi:predicted phosphodiesterase